MVLLAHDVETNMSSVVTYGKTTEQCSQAAEFGNVLKDELGWPKSLHSQPPRVQQLKDRIKELEKQIQGESDLTVKCVDEKCSRHNAGVTSGCNKFRIPTDYEHSDHT